MRSGATTFPPFSPPAPSWPVAAFTGPGSAWGCLQASGWRISLRSHPSTTKKTASTTTKKATSTTKKATTTRKTTTKKVEKPEEEKAA